MRITFGTVTISLVDNFIDFSPKGRSWIKWGLVIKSRKWSSWVWYTAILVWDDCSDGATPLPSTRICFLASLNRYLVRFGIHFKKRFVWDLVRHYRQYLPPGLLIISIPVTFRQRLHQHFIFALLVIAERVLSKRFERNHDCQSWSLWFGATSSNTASTACFALQVTTLGSLSSLLPLSFHRMSHRTYVPAF